MSIYVPPDTSLGPPNAPLSFRTTVEVLEERIVDVGKDIGNLKKQLRSRQKERQLLLDELTDFTNTSRIGVKGIYYPED